jgi:hypothetical protein
MIILAIIIISVLKNVFHENEKFTNYCSQCGYLGDVDCASCINCGTCIASNGAKECVPGDVNGPYFRKDCSQWYYNSIPWYRHPNMWVNNYLPYYWPYYRRGNRTYDRRRRYGRRRGRYGRRYNRNVEQESS